MAEARLDDVLEKLPSGLPLPVACWLVARIAHAVAARPRLLTPQLVRIRDDGGVRVGPPKGDVPFAYRAPEVIRRGRPSSRSTVFNLGALLVECLTGRSPFLRDSDMETRIAVAEESVPPLVGRVAQASGPLDVILARALSKVPEDRYGASVELGEALDNYLDEELHEVGPSDVVLAIRAGFELGSPRAALPASQPSRPASRSAEMSAVPRDVRAEVRAPVAAQPEAALPEAAERTRQPLPAPARRGSPPRRAEPPAPRPTPQPAETAPGAGPLPDPAHQARPLPTPLDTVERRRRPSSSTQRAANPSSAPSSAVSPPDPLASDRAEASVRPDPRRAAAPYEDAELDLGPRNPRSSAPSKPKLDESMVRLGDPLQAAGGGAGITSASITGDRMTDPGLRSSLQLDEDALQRTRPQVDPEEEAEEEQLADGPNWIRRIGLGLVALLGLAILYQFALRPMMQRFVEP